MDITSSNNKLIKEVKTLYKKRDRMKKSLFILEGIKMVKEALDRGYDLEYILYTEGLIDIKHGAKLYHYLNKLEKAKKVEEDIFKEISDTETPQGVMAVARFEFKNIDDIVEREKARLIFLDELQDPGNMGTIIRTADAFNIDGIIIKSGTVDPYNPKVVRSSMGSIFRVPIYYINDLEKDIEKLKKKEYKFLATRLENSKDIREVDFNKTVIVIGNESIGVSPSLESMSDEFIKIDMPGESESLNAAIAASIIMYESGKSLG